MNSGKFELEKMACRGENQHGCLSKKNSALTLARVHVDGVNPAGLSCDGVVKSVVTANEGQHESVQG